MRRLRTALKIFLTVHKEIHFVYVGINIAPAHLFIVEGSNFTMIPRINNNNQRYRHVLQSSIKRATAAKFGDEKWVGSEML